MWKTEKNYGFVYSVIARLKTLVNLFVLIVVCRGNKTDYLRRLGVQIDSGCSILTSIKNFGTEPWLIRIGQDSTITSGTIFITHDGSSRVFRKKLDKGNLKYGNSFRPVEIGRNNFIGVNTIILPGTKSGENVIIGAGSVVKGELEGNSVYAGVPAKRISSLAEYIEKYTSNMIPIESTNRKDLRSELLKYFDFEKK